MHFLCKCVIVAMLVPSLIQVKTFSPRDYREFVKLMLINPQMDNNSTEDIVPISYNVKLSIDFEDDNVILNGSAIININVINSTNAITLRAKNLIIKPNADLKCDHQIDVAISTVEPVNNITGLFNIILSKSLDVGSNCNLTFSFTRKNSASSTPMSQYIGELDNKTWTLVSQNIACDIFSCSPDRSLKAKCTLSIEHRKSYISLFFMDAVKHEINPQNPERVITHFAESPNMYPFDLVFAIGDFIKADDDNDELQVWATRGSSVNLNYAQEMGIKIMKALENYTGVPYETLGLKKLNIIIGKLPIEVLGISYWGFILIKVPAYSNKCEDPSLNSLQISDIKRMAHEISHQWFSHLVHRTTFNTMWLFEGIPEYLSYFIIDQIQPTWRMMDKLILTNLQFSSFKYDALNYVSHMTSENMNIFIDRPIIYDKSSCVIRMISHVMGEENFKIALKNFIKTKTSDVITNDVFFKELSTVYSGNICFTDVLNNWVNSPGYPVITVKRDYDTGKALITQSRFLSYINSKSVEKYWTPINFVTEDNLNFMDTNVTHWYDPSMSSIEIDQLKKDQFVIFNKQLFGYYRVNYDNQNWELIINYLNNKNYSRIHVLNRAQLIGDVYNFAKIGLVDHQVMWSVFEYLKRDTDFVPWSLAWAAIETMYFITVNSDIYDKYKNHVLELSKKLEQEVLSVQSYETDCIMKDRRNDALKWTCLLGSSSCKSEVTKKLTNWLDNPEINPLSPDEKKCIICAALRNADEELWDKVWDKYWTTNDLVIKSALICTLNVKILKKYLLKRIPDEFTIQQITSTFDEFLYHNQANGATVVVDYIIEHYNKNNNMSDHYADYLMSRANTLAYQIKDKIQCNKLKTFIEDNKASIKDADNIIIDIDKALKFVDRQLDKFKKFFNKNMTINSNSFILIK